MAERATLLAAPRTVLGKEVKRLRKQGIVPANVFGRGLASRAIQLDGRELMRTVRSAGVRSMFELRIEDEPDPRYVVLRGLTRAGGMGDPLHADFYQVNLDRPITTNVNLHLVGESPAVQDLAGTLILNLETVSVRCLPLAIPSHFEIDASLLKSFDTVITVADLKVPDGVEVLNDPAINVARVNPPRLRLEGADELEPAQAGADSGA